MSDEWQQQMAARLTSLETQVAILTKIVRDLIEQVSRVAGKPLRE